MQEESRTALLWPELHSPAAAFTNTQTPAAVERLDATSAASASHRGCVCCSIIHACVVIAVVVCATSSLLSLEHN